MPTYKIIVKIEREYEAVDEHDALEQFWESTETDNNSLEEIVSSHLTVL